MKDKIITGIGALILISLLLLIMKCQNSLKESNSGESSCNYKTSIEDIRVCSIGTWIAKPTGELWTKIIINNNGTYDMYNASPSSGKWPSSPSHSGTYSLDEARFSDTGEKYVYISLNGSGLCSYKMVFDGTTSLECNGNYDVLSKGDINPWY